MVIHWKHNHDQSWTRKLFARWIVSLSITVLFFTFYVFVLHPGYQVNDDITMMGLVSGYFGGHPQPFMVFSNIIVGLLLQRLYSLPTSLNWGILFFIVLNFFNVWSLVHLILISPVHRVIKACCIATVLLSDGYVLLNLTFTVIAAFSVISGICSVLSAAHTSSPAPRKFFFLGGIWIILGELIRVESVYLVILTCAISILSLIRIFQVPKLFKVLAIVGIIVLANFSIDRLYVHFSPAWDQFYRYSDTRSLIQDTNRLGQANFRQVARKVGWTKLDCYMFAGWFLADESTFSYRKLQYLVQHVSNINPSPIEAALYFFVHQAFYGHSQALSWTYLLLLLATLLLIIFSATWRTGLWSIAVLLLSFVALFLYLVGTQKMALRIWYSFLITVVVFSVFLVLWQRTGDADPSALLVPNRGRYARLSLAILGVVMSLALLLGLRQASVISHENQEKQLSYLYGLQKIAAWQDQGVIQPGSLIVVPALGIPLEWSNPLFLNWPKIQVLYLNWFAFSPPYEDMLGQYNARPLLMSLVQRDNVYIMAKRPVIPQITTFVGHHTGMNVEAHSIVSIRYRVFDGSAYGNIALYKLDEVK